MTFTKFKEAMKVHAKTKEYRDTVKKTNRIIKCLLRRYKPYVSYSGGKDSTVLLHLVLQYKKDVPVFHYDYGRAFIPSHIERTILENIRVIGASNVHVRRRPGGDRITARDNPILGVLFATSRRFADDNGLDLAIIGLRAEESLKRRRKTVNIINTRARPHEAYPLRDWTWKDVYAYIFENNLPLLPHYEILPGHSGAGASRRMS